MTLIFDSESDDLAYEATKLHIFSWTKDGENIYSTNDPEEIKSVLDEEPVAGCHNSIRHDFPLFKMLLGYTYTGLKVDTLALSWYLDPNRPKHGLESYGEDFGVPKIKVEAHQWKEGDWEHMKARCERDVLINWKLWKSQEKWLEGLYNGN